MSEQRKSSRLARYRAWKAGLDRRGRLRWRAIRVVAAICAGIVLVGAAYSAFARRPNVPSVPTGDDVSASANQTGIDGRRAGVYTFFLVGRDTGGGGNTDTMILVTYDTKHKTLDAMSLPRDTMTNVSWSNKKLNTVYNYYKGKDKETQVEKGMSALKLHVAKLTGIYPDFYVMVEWDAVGELVDALGGVSFDVPYDMHYDDPYQDLHIHQDKGVRKLTGEDAMQVIRWRKNNGKYGNFQIGDSGRMKIQQDFLVSVAKECLQLKHLMNAPEFARIFTENVDTDLTAGNLVWLAQQAIGMSAEEAIHFHTMPYTPYTRGTAYVLPVVDELLALVNGGLNPYQKEITADDLEVLQLKKDGALYLTSGTLADSSLAKPRKTQVTTKTEQTELPKEEPDREEQQEQSPDQSDQEQPLPQVPEEQLPSEETPQDPREPADQPPAGESNPDVSEQTGGEEAETTGQVESSGDVLHEDPVPVQ